MKAFAHWIPPVPLAVAQLSLAASWVLLYLCGATATFDGFFALAWVHAVALGWITLVALSVLLHVIPAFTDAPWRAEVVARAAVVIFAVGAAALIAGFATQSATLLEFGADVEALSLLVYIALALATLAQTQGMDRTGRAIGRAFASTFVFLAVAAALGAGFAAAFSGHAPSSLLSRAPAAHAMLAIGGWLTLLIMGVSARTMRPICGLKSRFPRLHIASGTLTVLGTLVAAIALGLGAEAVARAGVALLIAGMTVYAFDILDIVRHATVPHRPPQVLMGAAALFAVAAATLAVFSFNRSSIAEAAVVAALLGWAGSAVMAHLHHLGVRVITTYVRGDNDETRPWAVLDRRLTWFTAFAYLAGAACATLAAGSGSSGALKVAAVLGFVATAALAVNIGAVPGRLNAVPLTVA